MEKKILNFLSSGLLDKYVIGATTDVESKQVEEYINKYSDNLSQNELAHPNKLTCISAVRNFRLHGIISGQ